MDIKQEVYLIEGMNCAACSSGVERVTRKLPGVIRSDVNLTTNKMTIEYDADKLTPEQIMGEIEKAGFGATLFTEEKQQTRKKRKKMTGKKSKKHFSRSATALL